MCRLTPGVPNGVIGLRLIRWLFDMGHYDAPLEPPTNRYQNLMQHQVINGTRRVQER